jgi:hypothetical protein
MTRSLLHGLAICSLGVVTCLAGPEGSTQPSFRFRMEEVDKSLKVGYAVLLADLNGDGKKDIIVVDTTRVIWFENPTWKMRTILQGQTKPDNVCIDAYDINGDGQLDLALGADWKPFNTKDGGTLQWLKRGKTLDEPWTLYPIDTEPTLHRIRFADLDGDGKAELIAGPLMGRNSSREKNWMDGQPLRLLAYIIPKDPVKDRWTPVVLNQSLHVMHNFQPVKLFGTSVLTASYDGVHALCGGRDGKWDLLKLGEGNQDTPNGNRGASEIRLGHLRQEGTTAGWFIATIEPWHGHQVVVYTPSDAAFPQIVQKAWKRHVIDDQLKWGHAIACADLDGDGKDEIIVGVRDDFSDQHRRGVRIYRVTNFAGTKWERHLIDNGGIAVEDLAAADLNGDGRIDLVAVGRATGNVRIYWNEGNAGRSAGKGFTRSDRVERGQQDRIQ